MNEDLEKQLRSALRAVDPDDGFIQRVLARVASREPPASDDAPATSSRLRFFRPRVQWLTAALAATLVLGVVGVHFYREQSERAAGIAAREQLLEALRVTSEKL